MMEGATLVLQPCPEPRCSMPYETVDRWIAESTDGPVEMAKGQCLDGHHFNMPTAMNDTNQRATNA